MRNIISITQLSLKEAKALTEMLLELDSNLEKKIDKVMNITKFDYISSLEYVVCQSPLLWAKVYLNWTGRDYQKAILAEGKRSNQLVLRLGRRLGKTDSMCVLIWWYAVTQINKGPNSQYNILILTPYETQIDLIFERLDSLLEGSPMLKNMLKRSIHHQKELKNGAIIRGLTAGASSGANGSNNTRGQRSDLIILDEVDYIGSSQLTNILNIRNEAPERIRIIAASTPSGKHEEFYNWCVNASKTYMADPEDVKNFRFTGYIVKDSLTERGDNGNGWTQICAPSIVNKELLKVNPITEQTYLEDLKDELTERRFAQEVMAEFGELETGVYDSKFLDIAVNEGIRIDQKYVDEMTFEERRKFAENRHNNIRILGIDWDKVQAGTTIAGVEYDKTFIDANGNNVPKFRVFLKIEIPRSEMTYTNAVDKIIQLNDEFNFDWIALDKGYGDYQLEK